MYEIIVSILVSLFNSILIQVIQAQMSISRLIKSITYHYQALMLLLQIQRQYRVYIATDLKRSVLLALRCLPELYGLIIGARDKICFIEFFDSIHKALMGIVHALIYDIHIFYT